MLLVCVNRKKVILSLCCSKGMSEVLTVQSLRKVCHTSAVRPPEAAQGTSGATMA